MASPVTCPRCGSDETRQITPGYYECTAQIAVGGIPPSLTGLSHPIPDIQPCGARFQLGVPVATPSCALCGLDSIGTCEGCRRRLCGNHGTASPPFLCRECLNKRTAERERARAGANARLEEETRQRRHDVASVLATSRDPREITEALTADEAAVDSDQCRAAWSRLIGDLSLEPTHEYVEVIGNSTKWFIAFGASPTDRERWKESSAARVGVWLAPQAGTIRHRRLEEEAEGRLEANIDLFLDRDGNLWRTWGSGKELWIPSLVRGQRDFFVLPRGRAFEAAPNGRHLKVVDGIAVQPFDTSQEDVRWSATVLSGLVRAVATILAKVERNGT